MACSELALLDAQWISMAEQLSQVQKLWLQDNTNAAHKAAYQNLKCARQLLQNSFKACEAKLTDEAIWQRLVKLDTDATMMASQKTTAEDDWAQNCTDTARSCICDGYATDLLAMQGRLKALELRLEGDALCERLLLVSMHVRTVLKELRVTLEVLAQSHKDPDLNAVWTKVSEHLNTLCRAMLDRHTALNRVCLDAIHASNAAAAQAAADTVAPMRFLSIGEYVKQAFPPAIMTDLRCIDPSYGGCGALTGMHDGFAVYQYEPRCVKEWKYLDPSKPGTLEVQHALHAFQDNVANILQQAGSPVPGGWMYVESGLPLNHQPSVEFNVLRSLRELTRFLYGTTMPHKSAKMEWDCHSPHIILRFKSTQCSRVQTISSIVSPASATAAGVTAVSGQAGMEGGSSSTAAAQVPTAIEGPPPSTTVASRTQCGTAVRLLHPVMSSFSSATAVPAEGGGLGEVASVTALPPTSGQQGPSACVDAGRHLPSLKGETSPSTSKQSKVTRKRQRSSSGRINRARKRWGGMGSNSTVPHGHPIRCFIKVTEAKDVCELVSRPQARIRIHDVRPIDIVAAYPDERHPDHRKARKVCAQAMECMLQWKAQYAVVSCYWFTWLLHLPAQGRCERVLHIHGPVRADTAAPGITPHTALLYSMCRALEKAHEHVDDGVPDGTVDTDADALSAEIPDSDAGQDAPIAEVSAYEAGEEPSHSHCSTVGDVVT